MLMLITVNGVPTSSVMLNIHFNYTRWTKKSNPTDIYQVKPHTQISMLNKSLYSVLCVQGFFLLSTAPKRAAQRPH